MGIFLYVWWQWCPNSIYQTEKENCQEEENKRKRLDSQSHVESACLSCLSTPFSPPQREKKMEVSWYSFLRRRARKTWERAGAGGTMERGGRGCVWGGCLLEGPLHLSEPTFLNIPVVPQTKHGERARNWPRLCLSTADLSDRTCRAAKLTCASHKKTQEKHMHDQVCALLHTPASTKIVSIQFGSLF